MKKLFAGDLWPMLTTESGNARLSRLEARLAVPLDTLIESLVLYDEVVIPTQDFIIIPALTRALGEQVLRELLESHAIKFLRVKKGIVFSTGDGAGVYEVRRKDGQLYPFAADLDWVIRWASQDFARAKDAPSLITAVQKVTSEVDADELVSVIRAESEDDVLGSEAIRELFSLPNGHPRDYPGKPRQMHLYGGPQLPSEYKEIDSFLRLVQSNVELHLAGRMECDDVASATDLDTILEGKFARSGHSEVVSHLFEIANVPDFAPLVRTGQMPVKQLLKLRDSKNGKEFRGWFHENLRDVDAKTISKAYVDLIQEIPAVDSIPGRLLRVLGWTSASAAAGSVAGPVGTVAGAVVGGVGSLLDSFVLSKLRLGGSPKVFLDKLRYQAAKSQKHSG